MMKKKLMILAVSAFAFLGVSAQNDKPCGEARCLRQFEGLGLTDAQKTQLVELNKARAAEFKALRKDCRDRKNRCDSTARVDRRAAQAKYLAELKKVLTPEQYTQFLENAYLNGGRNLKVKAPMRYVRRPQVQERPPIPCGQDRHGQGCKGWQRQKG